MIINPDIKEITKIREEIVRDDNVKLDLLWIKKIIEKWESKREQYDYPSEDEIKKLIEMMPISYNRFLSMLDKEFVADLIWHIIREWAVLED